MIIVVDQGFKTSGLKREEVFITTKICLSNYGENMTYDSFLVKKIRYELC